MSVGLSQAQPLPECEPSVMANSESFSARVKIDARSIASSSVLSKRIMKKPTQGAYEDPLSWITRIVNKLRTLWVVWTYPFYSIGSRVSIDYSTDFKRSITPYIKIGNSVIIDRDVWLNIPVLPDSSEPVLLFDEGCAIGRRCVISAKNRIHFERDVILGPSVLIMDHNHAFEDVTIPIKDQGITAGGSIRLEEGCWIGFGAAIVCNNGELVIGRNSVIGANAVVTRSIPANSVVSGNPARIVKQFDPSKGEWVLGVSGFAKEKKIAE
jgi:acetyltransferase-like isoleucine patch superfamily enzyme